jgi:peptidoglycan/xylan/chitin deacetylase (PgdA/CDA1 family)
MGCNCRSNTCIRLCRQLVLAWLLVFFAAPALPAQRAAAILVYHRFGASVVDGMTTRTAVFEAQLARLRQEGYAIVPLASAVAGLEGKAELAPKTVAITVDDGHRSVYTDLLPIIRRERVPVALFIYPSAISNASYAMTWEQLAEVVATGLVEVHSHTYWHPDFRVERRRLAPDRYGEFVRNQLEKPRRVLKSRLGVDASYLAWPFGIHDAELEAAASAAGYRAAFALGERHATDADPLLALPRYLIVDAHGVAGLMRLLNAGERRVAGAQP